MSEWLDPFYVFRTMLFAVLSIYYVVYLVVAGVRVAVLLGGQDPQKRLLRLYLSYHLVTVRFAPVASELLQILFWTVALLLLYWLHTRI